ncbi:hypothetical protein FHT07_002137 [Xanthomonas arboricola]|nr:hypothetical protein [Xanthomonas arboricola]
MWVCCQRHELPVPFGCSKCCSRPAAVALAAVSAELMHAACQNGVPGFRRGGAGASGRGGGGVYGRARRFQVNGLIDFFQGRRCAGGVVRANALAGRRSCPGRLECLETASAVQSIGDPDQWRLSDARCWSVTGLLPSLASVMASRADRFVGAHPGATGRAGKANRAQVRSYGGVGVCGALSDCLACRRSAPGRDGLCR